MYKSDLEHSLNLMSKLSNITLPQDQLGVGEQEERITDHKRFSDILKLLIEHTPVKYATLWKMNHRIDTASVVARPWTNARQDVPYNVPITGTQFEMLVNRWREKKNNDGRSLGMTAIDDISLERTDPYFFTEERQKDLGAVKQLAIPFGTLSESHISGAGTPDFLLNMVVGNSLSDQWIPRHLLEAIVSRLDSGASALIDRKIRRITAAMTNIKLTQSNAGSAEAMKQGIVAVLPRYITCQAVIRVLPVTGGNYRIEEDFVRSPDVFGSGKLDREAVQEIGELVFGLFDQTYGGNPTDRPDVDTIILSTEQLFKVNKIIEKCGYRKISSALVGRIHSRAAPQHSKGIVVLLNRINELAVTENRSDDVLDQFDWENQVYLSHICSIMDLVVELYIAEEARLQRAHILSHEISAPSGFIFSTAERLLENAKGDRAMPSGMVKRELEDLMVTSQFQTLLVDSMMIGLQTGNASPQGRYMPSRSNLDEIVGEVARLVFPLCRRFKVNPSGIKIGKLPSLYIDKRATTQVFLNLISNAIKYSSASGRNDFSLVLSAERISSKELEVTRAPSEYLQYLKANSNEEGFLFSVKDCGIGVSQAFSSKMFAVGARDTSSQEVASKLGAGLGLAVVRSILRDHFGEVWLEQYRKPTEFQFFLPRSVESGEYQEHSDWIHGRTTNG